MGKKGIYFGQCGETESLPLSFCLSLSHTHSHTCICKLVSWTKTQKKKKGWGRGGTFSSHFKSQYYSDTKTRQRKENPRPVSLMNTDKNLEQNTCKLNPATYKKGLENMTKLGSFWCNELTVVMTVQLCDLLKNTELYSLNGWIV